MILPLLFIPSCSLAIEPFLSLPADGLSLITPSQPPGALHIHPYEFRYIRHASVCTRMPPYASFTPPIANVQHTFSEK